jgi:serine/threonine protein kinase
MSIALSEFWTRLVRSGITDAAGCKQLATGFSKANRGTPPSDSVTLAKYMIKAGKLTQFQARALLADPPREIRAGSYLIRSDKSSPPLSKWVDAGRIDGGQAGMLFRASNQQLSGGRTQWLTAHAAVQAATLQPLESESQENSTLVFSQMPTGRCLQDVIGDGGQLAPRKACEIGIAIGDALDAMHALRLIHGSVRSDRVWIGDRGKTVLLRDPSGPPVGPHGDSSRGWLDDLEQTAPYAAPELADSERPCDQATDIYSLGCLLFRLVTGQHAFESLASHASDTPPELAEAIVAGSSGDPLFRVIAFALAKDPARRFTTAQQLANALSATIPLLPKVKQSVAGGAKAQVGAKRTPHDLSTPAETTSHVAEPKQAFDVSPTIRIDSEVTPPVAPETATAEPPMVSDESSQSPPHRPVRRRKKKKNRATLVLGGLCVAVLMLIIGLVVHDPNQPVAKKKRERPPIPAVIPSVTNRPSRPAAPPKSSDPPADESAGGYQQVSDYRLLFVPPYAADTPKAPLELLPPGPAVIVSARLAEIRANRLGSKLIESLSPELDNVIQAIATRSRVPLESISRCSAAMFPGKDGWPEISLAIELARPQPRSELLEKWQVAASRTPDGATIYAGDEVDSDAFYLPDSQAETVSRFAVGSVKRISEVAAAEGGAVVLPRALQRLWNGTSDQADLVILTSPNFLFADGRSLLQASAPELVGPLKQVLIPDVAGVVAMTDFGDDQVFAEIRVAPSGISQAALMQSLRGSILSWPDWANDFIVDSVPDPSWRLLASRLPSMMRFVVDHFRFGISGDAVVANTYLPEPAVVQVTLATLLALNTPPGGAIASTTGQPTPSLSLDEMLDRKMSVEFGQESLEFAIDAIVSDFQQELPTGSTLPPIRIIGGDLQLMGITQNQQVRNFAKSDLPLRTVLTDLVLGANPDKTATGPKDPKQALIWVVADDPENAGQQAILITTRQAAEGNYDLPSEFQLEP